jgi:hypothetical protein
MAIIYTYPIVIPTSNDLVLGTDVDAKGKPTKNFTIQSIIDLVTVSGNDLQAVLNNGNTATQNIVLTGNISATQYTDGTMVVVGGVGTGFSSITSTDFVGNLTGIVKAGSSIEGTVTGVTQNQGDNSTKLATTAYVDNQVDPSVLQYLGDSTGPFDLNLVNDDFKIAGTANEIETTATTVAGNVGTVTLKFPTAGVTLPDGSVATTQAAADNTTKVATDAFVQQENNAQDLDFKGDTAATGSVLLNSQTLTIAGTSNEITTVAANQTLTIGLPNDVTISGTYTGTTFAGDLLGTVNTATTGVTQTAGDDSTKIATTAYVDNAAGAKTLDYAGDATGPFALNLSTDDLEFNGDSNITVTAAAVAANKGIVTIDLNNDVTISGTMQAGTLSDGTFSGTAGTYTGGVSITSTDFIGALTGNASTATALASSGAIALTGDTTSTGGPYTYTSGGALSIATTIADTTVTGKVLTNLPTPTSGSIAATDTILAAMAKLQGQITSTTGLAYEGTWDARNSAEGGSSDGGNPDLTQASTKVNGHFYIVSTAGNAEPNGGAGTQLSPWAVGDWCIYVSNGSSTDEWQKLDQSNEVLGSGAVDKIAKWTATNTLGTGLIEDNGTTVTVGNSGNLTVEGNTTLGNADTDTTTVKGPARFEETLRADVGIGLGGATYGTAGQVLTSGGGAATVNTWETPTTGTVTSVALTETGDALTITGSPITASGTINIAGAGASTEYINGELNLVTFPTLDNYVDWKLQGDSGTNQDITKQTIVDFAGGTYISTATTTDTLTINHDATSRTDTTSSDAPAFAGTFEAVTSVTSNATGHVTAIDVSTVTIPSNPVMTAATGAAAGVQGLVPGSAAGDQLKFLRADATWVIPDNDQGVTSVGATAPISSSGGTTPNITHDVSGVTAGTYDSVTVDDKGHVTAGSNPGGSGGGIFSGDQTITSTTPAQKAFTLNRATTGTLIFDVWFTSETSTATSVAKKYTVAHANNTTPVYNKIIDTGPAGSNDFDVSFVNAGSGLSVECEIIGQGIASQNIGYTVQVGHDSTNALTFTAAS